MKVNLAMSGGFWTAQLFNLAYIWLIELSIKDNCRRVNNNPLQSKFTKKISSFLIFFFMFFVVAIFEKFPRKNFFLF